MTLIPLERPTYLLDGWGGNFSDEDAVDWVVTSEEGWASAPAVRTSIEERPGASGGSDAPSYDSPRIITLSGTAIAPTRRAQNEAKDRFNGFAPSGPSLFTLIVDEEHLTRIAYVRRSGDAKISDRGGYAFDFSVTLIAPDPRRYAATETVQSVSVSSVLTDGRQYPRTYPLTYGAIASIEGGLTAVVANDGNASTGAILEIVGGIARPTVTNLRTGQSVAFDTTVGPDDVLTIDLDAHTATLNESSSRRSTIVTGSSWWLCAPGETPLQFGGAPTGVGTPRMTLRYRSAWK